jgi:ABC-2 type transport system permease protein
MRNAFLVALREYVENAKTKGFWIGIFMFPLVIFLSFQIPMLLEKKGAPVRHFVLIDYSGEFDALIEKELDHQYYRRLLSDLLDYARENTGAVPEFARQFAGLQTEAVSRFVELGGQAYFLRELAPDLPPNPSRFAEPRKLFHRVPQNFVETNATNATSETLIDALRPYLRGEQRIIFDGAPVKLDAAIIIPKDLRASDAINVDPSKSVQYWSGNLTDKTLRTHIENALNREIDRREYLARGLDPALYRQIEGSRVPVAELNPKKEQGQERVSKAEVLAQWAPVAFVYLLWVALFSISQMLLSNTVEEKSNRIIEVLLSSVTPAEFILGKLAGIAAVGLTMVGAWLGSLLAVVAWKMSGQSEVATQFLTMLRGSHLLPAFIVYFFFGYLLYAGIILSIGSVCNTLKEAQNYMGVITMLMMVPLLTMMFIPKDPHGTVATVLSWIPIYTPFIMMNRAAADPPLFDLIGTMLLLVLSTALVLWAAVKIFRAGILRTGQPPRLVEILRWLRGS